MAKEVSKCFDIAGINDKHQITTVIMVSMDGNFLPIQLIFQGKTRACLPCAKFPTGWHITCTHNHWANEKTTKDHIEKIIVPI